MLPMRADEIGVGLWIKCCVDIYGIADIGTYHAATMLGTTFADAPELYAKASPVTYVRSNSPPILILHGTADPTVNVNQSEKFAEILQRAGAKHELLIAVGAAATGSATGGVTIP